MSVYQSIRLQGPDVTMVREMQGDVNRIGEKMSTGENVTTISLSHDIIG